MRVLPAVLLVLLAGCTMPVEMAVWHDRAEAAGLADQHQCPLRWVEEDQVNHLTHLAYETEQYAIHAMFGGPGNGTLDVHPGTDRAAAIDAALTILATYALHADHANAEDQLRQQAEAGNHTLSLAADWDVARIWDARDWQYQTSHYVYTAGAWTLGIDVDTCWIHFDSGGSLEIRGDGTLLYRYDGSRVDARDAFEADMGYRAPPTRWV